jgi:hypothetical protein
MKTQKAIIENLQPASGFDTLRGYSATRLIAKRNPAGHPHVQLTPYPPLFERREGGSRHQPYDPPTASGINFQKAPATIDRIS